MHSVRDDLQLILLDLDGTLIYRSQWIPGAVSVLQGLLDRGYEVRIVTNTTLHNRTNIAQHFQQAGLDLSPDWIFTPAVAASVWIREHAPGAQVLALVHPRAHEDLAGVRLTEREPADIVLIGDMGDAWNVQILNTALRCLMSGARFTALQRNRRWLAADGYRLDAGALVAALEYASGRTCELVFGKPNPVFFQMALHHAGVQPHQALMVGDHPVQDIQGAKQCGIHALQVRSPAISGEPVEPFISPDGILDKLSELPHWIEKHAHAT